MYVTSHDEKSFVSWMRETNQIFAGDEYHFRFGIFLANQRFVQEHNRQNGKTFKVTLNKFACYTPAEYNALLGYRPSTHSKTETFGQVSSQNAPDQVDWRKKGAVNAVQDQGNCGSCWAFSACASFEGTWFLDNNELLKVSEQFLVDCVRFCLGCMGGNPSDAFIYVMDFNKGKWNLLSDYPYKAIDQDCQYDSSKGVGFIRSYFRVFSQDVESKLAEACAEHGPLSIAINAGAPSFRLYSKGVYDEKNCDPTVLNHAVTLVGYGTTEDQIPYYIVKNSWGQAWGEEGYIRIIRGCGMCGINKEVFCPSTK